MKYKKIFINILSLLILYYTHITLKYIKHTHKHITLYYIILHLQRKCNMM